MFHNSPKDVSGPKHYDTSDEFSRSSDKCIQGKIEQADNSPILDNQDGKLIRRVSEGEKQTRRDWSERAEGKLRERR